ncbi:MAG: aminotransferase class V-fold PLP-dependent enzyme [Cetobacterium sp.]|nr:aminotransferase class V-fold PLP-dependent enzyme [Cetobacterium sp.]
MIYFDNAATTFPKMKSLYRDTMTLYEKFGTNFSRNHCPESLQLNNIFSNLKENIKKLFSAPSSFEVIINSSATFSANEILRGLDFSNIKNIYISPFEHNSIYRVLKDIEKNNNFNIETIPFDNFQLKKDELILNFMSKKPDLIICTHASNVFGNILPIEEIFSLGKKYNSINILDGAQTGGVLDFSKITPLSDFIIFAGHKNLYGPSGIGGYIYNKSIHLNPLLHGGTGIKSEEINMPKDIPEKFQAGSPNTLVIIGLYLSTKELLKIGIENIYKKKYENFNFLYEILENYDYDLKILSPKENNIGIISLTSCNHTPQEIEKLLNTYDIAVRVGLHCAPLAHIHMNTISSGGTIRMSIGYFNYSSDFEILDDTLNEIL